MCASVSSPASAPCSSQSTRFAPSRSASARSRPARSRCGLRFGLSRQAVVVSSVPAPSLSMLPPSSTSPGTRTGARNSPAAARPRLTRLSWSAANFRPQALKPKSSTTGASSSSAVIGPKSRAQVSFVGNSANSRWSGSAPSRSSRARTGATCGATMSTRSNRLMATAIRLITGSTRSSVSAQSVAACGQASRTASCSSHSAGSRLCMRNSPSNRCRQGAILAHPPRLVNRPGRSMHGRSQLEIGIDSCWSDR